MSLHHSRLERAGKIVSSIKKALDAIDILDRPGRPGAAGVRTACGNYIECPTAGIVSIQRIVRRELVDQIAALKREAAQINLSLEGL